MKIRGFRIEPGEVEAVLASAPGVETAVVVVREDEPGERRLVGYFVPEHAEAPVKESTLRDPLAEHLPAFMLPSALVMLDALPLTPNGKLDRKALPVPRGFRPDEAGTFLAPRGQMEELVAGLWAEVLGIEKVGAEDDFFVLGGHSLLATQVISRLRDALGVEVPLRDLFEHPTVAGLAAAAQDALQTGGTAMPPLEKVPRDERLPLSFAQQRLWFIDQLEPESPAYNMPMPLRLKGALDGALLDRALSEVVRRHEVLRTRFDSADGRPHQVIQEAEAVFLPRVDLRGLGGEESLHEARRLSRRDASSPFDLARGPVMRGSLLLLGEGDHVVLFNLHHIAGDGWSTGILVDEVSELYSAFAQGREPDLPQLPVQYADFAAWQRGWLQGEVLEGELAHWRQRLEGAPPYLDLPTDRPRPQDPLRRSETVRWDLSPELSASLRHLGRKRGATAFMTLAAAFQLFLGRLSGQGDVSLGTPIAGRTQRQVEGLIGFFVNTLVLRTRFSPGDSFEEVLARVRESVLEAQTHQHVPFERLVEELVSDRELPHPPLFRVLFSLQNMPEGQLGLGDLQVEPLEESGGVAKYDLNLSLSDDGGTFSGGLEIDTDLLDASTARRWLEQLEHLLTALVEAPDRPVAELSWVSPAERNQLLGEWAGATSNY
ncbi:MAG: non-ribosomal peptide synthetase, partial [Acidobacteria bacterium]|nr:non-ribosomal peptide synthetase [Acidobacteriota bacterium]